MDPQLVAWLKADDTRALTWTLFGEARSEPIEGRIAVGCVIRNRARRQFRGTTIAEVCFWPWQFSCWREQGGAANFAHLVSLVRAFRDGGPPPWSAVDRAIFDETCWIASGLVTGFIRDRVAGSLFYYAPAAMPKGKPPAWAVRDGQPITPTAVVGAHRFFAQVA